MAIKHTSVQKFLRAWSNYQQTEEFKTAVNPETLKAPKDQQKYLENRIRFAFEAGWNAARSKQ